MCGRSESSSPLSRSRQQSKLWARTAHVVTAGTLCRVESGSKDQKMLLLFCCCYFAFPAVVLLLCRMRLFAFAFCTNLSHIFCSLSLSLYICLSPSLSLSIPLNRTFTRVICFISVLLLTTALNPKTPQDTTRTVRTRTVTRVRTGRSRSRRSWRPAR